jgi:hypothetical protein
VAPRLSAGTELCKAEIKVTPCRLNTTTHFACSFGRIQSLAHEPLVNNVLWLRLFQNLSFEETGFACPATYKNRSFAARRAKKG